MICGKCGQYCTGTVDTAEFDRSLLALPMPLLYLTVALVCVYYPLALLQLQTVSAKFHTAVVGGDGFVILLWQLLVISNAAVTFCVS